MSPTTSKRPRPVTRFGRWLEWRLLAPRRAARADRIARMFLEGGWRT